MSSKKALGSRGTPESTSSRRNLKANLFSTPSNLRSSRSTPDQSVLNITKFGDNKEFLALPDYELECDLAYNDYLQSLLKAQIVKIAIAHHKEQLKEQLLYQKDILLDMQLKYCQRQDSVSEIKQKEEALEKIQVLKKEIDELIKTLKSFGFEQNMNNLHNVLKRASNSLHFVNVKALKTQKEYDTFMKLVCECTDLINKLIASRKTLQEVNLIGEKVVEINNLKKAADNKASDFSKLYNESAINFLQELSDMFAVKGKYDEVPRDN